jgi:hypothetical protein
MERRLTMPEAPRRRALRKLEAKFYNSLPARDVLQAATQLEQAKIERATRDGQLGLQRGSLCIAVLSQLPRDKDELKPLFQKANELLSEILDTERARMREALKEAEELGEDDAEIDLGDEDYDELLK